MRARSVTESWLGVTLALLAFAALSGIAGTARAEVGLRYESPDEPASLAGRWRFHLGDDPSWAAPDLDDTGWERLEVPRPWGQQGHRGYTGLAWYRQEVVLGERAAAAARAGQLALRFGSVDSSYELFLGGRRAGEIGSMPPHAVGMYDRIGLFSVPPDAVGTGDRLAIALRVWRSGETRPMQGGITNGPLQIGLESQLSRTLLLGELRTLALVVLFVVAGFHHLQLYWRRRSLREFLWFGATALLLGAYTFLRSDFKFLLSDDFRLFKNLEFLVLYLSPVVEAELFFALFSRPVPKLLRAGQVWSGSLALGTALTPGIGFELGVLTAWQVSVVAMIGIVGAMALTELWRGHSEARRLAGGLGALGGSVLHDMALSFGWFDGPRLMPYGFAFFILSMSALLAHRFARAYADLERFNVELSERVQEQTAVLQERAAELEHKNEQIEEAYRRVRESSLNDPLTGLRNRCFYQEHIGLDVARMIREHEAAQRRNSGASPSPSCLTFLLIDVDEFKAVNDRHGHKAGDLVLEQTAAILQGVCRESDTLVRWGGEEFLVVSRQQERAGAVVLAERLRSSVAAHDLALGDGGHVSLTVSIGFACFPLDENAPRAIGHERMIEIADACLYRVKESGRDGWLGVLRAPDADARLERREPWPTEGVEIASSQ